MRSNIERVISANTKNELNMNIPMVKLNRMYLYWCPASLQLCFYATFTLFKTISEDISGMVFIYYV